ncbi:SHOCT domain-containing protein [Bacillus fonticola]|uniref:SHOCT domain-containing protein n=1 Tax=Bacillus fonticola TaxID=2728853 RepID=UPI0014729060|nr:SHOCT domain-containing protein [Bacillus fonticola]
MMWNNGADCLGGGFPMMFGGGLLMLLFWGLIIWLVIYAIRKWSPTDRSNSSDKAVEILKQRYSRGEIDTEEYRQRLRELTDTTNKI